MNPSNNFLPHVEKPPDPEIFPPLDLGTGKRGMFVLAVNSKSKKKKDSITMVLGGSNKSKFVNLNVNRLVEEIHVTQYIAKVRPVGDRCGNQLKQSVPHEAELGLVNVVTGIVMTTHDPNSSAENGASDEESLDEAESVHGDPPVNAMTSARVEQVHPNQFGLAILNTIQAGWKEMSMTIELRGIFEEDHATIEWLIKGCNHPLKEANWKDIDQYFRIEAIFRWGRITGSGQTQLLLSGGKACCCGVEGINSKFKEVVKCYKNVGGGGVDAETSVFYQKPSVCMHCNVFGHSFHVCKERPRSEEDSVKKNPPPEKNTYQDQGNGLDNTGGQEEDGFVTKVNCKTSVLQRKHVNQVANKKLNTKITKITFLPYLVQIQALLVVYVDRVEDESYTES
ncbi:hypothetical protein E3N88_32054 [Mikania micrantha]|uniref:DUF4283 domain-containing protein n=1 Tax=Mikania micrantha TaxID=192012 RepID=A0A5N6M7C5_9ASTR|nr:hypothetical protein E3N88_32054 [Mikania micrantha]